MMLFFAPSASPHKKHKLFFPSLSEPKNRFYSPTGVQKMHCYNVNQGKVLLCNSLSF